MLLLQFSQRKQKAEETKRANVCRQAVLYPQYHLHAQHSTDSALMPLSNTKFNKNVTTFFDNRPNRRLNEVQITEQLLEHTAEMDR
jgi:hypothetical protein